MCDNGLFGILIWPLGQKLWGLEWGRVQRSSCDRDSKKADNYCVPSDIAFIFGIHVYVDNTYPCAHNVLPIWPWPWTWGQFSGFEIFDRDSKNAHIYFRYCFHIWYTCISGQHISMDIKKITPVTWTWGQFSGFEICHSDSKRAHNFLVT